MYELGFISGLPLVMQLPDLPGWPMSLVAQRLSTPHHGDYARWQAAIDALPMPEAHAIEIADTISIRFQTETSLQPHLIELHPWRKGPYLIGDEFINTEWRSDWKWQRLAPYIDLMGHRVLDVGSGNGYFGWRMLAAGAEQVIGIDPSILFCMQFRLIQKYMQAPNHWVLPFGIDDIPHEPIFDSVFSMGVIYHRREPKQHAQQLADLTKPGGQVILESLVNTGDQGFKPEHRYARMRNVWWLPSVAELIEWLTAAGLTEVECLDETVTTIEEQRSTDWMRFESLAQSLDSADPTQTVEGYPAPRRALILARKP